MWSRTEETIHTYFQKRLNNILNADQFDRAFLEHLYKVTNKVRTVAKTTFGSEYLKKLLSNKRAMLYFDQPSTRTFMSFLNACQVLGMSTSEVRDTSTSSEVKGESKLDSLRTLSSYVDLIIMRTSDENFAEESAEFLEKTRRPVPIVNAGSGAKEHPTQALLDMYTLQRSFKNNGGLEGKTILFCGDLKRGRTVKSLLKLLSHYENVKVILCAPKAFQLNCLDKEREEYLNSYVSKGKGSAFFKIPDGYTVDTNTVMLSSNLKVSNSDNLEEYLSEADAVYMTRIQDEYDTKDGESQKSYDGFKLTKGNIKLMKPNSIIMHPLPRRDEVAVEIDEDPRAMYWRQCRNGMWTRVALIAYLFEKDEEILRY